MHTDPPTAPSRATHGKGGPADRTLPRCDLLLVDDPQAALRGLDESRVVSHHHHATVELEGSFVRSQRERQGTTTKKKNEGEAVGV